MMGEGAMTGTLGACGGDSRSLAVLMINILFLPC